MTCLSDEQIADLVAGVLRDEELAAAERHIDACEGCRGTFVEVACDLQESRALARKEHAGPPGDAVTNDGSRGGHGAAPLQPGTAIHDRYVLLERIGTGATGHVYTAYDPKLDRRVAVKLIRPELLAGPRGASRRARLIREAQTVARLTHPNIVVVYDVGSFDQQVFVAMQFVEGTTLRRWLASAPRPTTKRVLDVFVRAGRGLAAAHSAGIAHRDFKPDNVLIGDDGSVRVIDFGLARHVTSPDAGGGGAEEWELGEAAAPTLTRTGTLVGTPAYMAPEQHAGDRADERSDQFAFCVALHEALCGVHPFPATTLAELSRRVRGGHLEPLPRTASVPAHVRAALLRGLKLDPAQRFPSMTALCSALESRSRKTGRALAVAAAAVVTLGAINLDTGGGTSLCGGSEQKIAATWTEQARAGIRAAFLASAAPEVRASAGEVESRLDGFSRRWVEARRDACEATHVRGEQSAELLDLRMQCYEKKLAEARALSDLLAAGSEKVLEQATKLADRLADLRPCADIEVLKGGQAAPDTPSEQQQLSGLVERTGRLQLLAQNDSVEEGRKLARGIADDAERLGYKSIAAEALRLLGPFEAQSGDLPGAERTLRRALHLAEETRNDRVAAVAWLDLSDVVARGGRPAEAYEMALHSEAFLKRIDATSSLRSRALHQLGICLEALGRLPEAQETLERAVALRESDAKDPLALATSLNLLGSVLEHEGQPAAALTVLRRALAIREQALGPASPRVAGSLNNIGKARQALGDRAGAADDYARALAIRTAALGPEHPDVALILLNQASLDRERGRRAEAGAGAARALTLLERAYGPEHPLVAEALDEVAAVAVLQGDVARAEASYRRSLALREKTLGPAHLDLATPLLGLARIDLARGAHESAIEPLERALALRAELGPPADHAELELALARALWASGRDKGRAKALAEAARDAVNSLGEPGRPLLDQIERWLRDPGPS